MLFRFNGILRHRVRAISAAFQAAIAEYDFQGKYCPIFPIKVNQVRHVVDVINEAGLPFDMGLEVGSKPELMAVLAIQDNPEALLVCNGYKDRRYIELALMAKRVGRRPVIVIEKPSEIALVLDVAEELGVEPEIGFRLRLAGKGRRPLGAQRRRARQVRADRLGDRGRGELPARGAASWTACGSCTSTTAAS
ncbi:MAG: hypothetical protein IPH09_11660 [bacterium]|nr:hypothetical protein [bacterium]